MDQHNAIVSTVSTMMQLLPAAYDRALCFAVSHLALCGCLQTRVSNVVVVEPGIT